MIRLAMRSVAYERGYSAKNVERHGATIGCNVTLPSRCKNLSRKKNSRGIFCLQKNFIQRQKVHELCADISCDSERRKYFCR